MGGRPTGFAGAGPMAIHAQRQADEPAGRVALVADAVFGPQVGSQRQTRLGQTLAQHGAAGAAIQAPPDFAVLLGPAANGFDRQPQIAGDGRPRGAAGPQFGGLGNQVFGWWLVRGHEITRTIEVGLRHV